MYHSHWLNDKERRWYELVICTVEVNEKSPQTIVIGRRGTYNTQEIVFDIGYLIDAYGAGTAVLAVKRSQDSSAYPAVVAQEDSTVTWTVSETDTYYKGAGECELMWYVDGGLAKTIIYPMVVMRDILSTTEEAPDAYQTWVDDLTALGTETLQNAQDAAQSASDAESAKDDAVTAKEAAEEAAEKAEEASVHAPVIQGGYWYIWNNGQYVNTGVQAEGQKGDKGDPGEKGETGNGIASITKTGTSGLVDTYTVTYTDGTTTTFTVTNGAKGDKGDTGATGNGIQSITKTGTSGNVDTYTITYTNGQTTTFTVTNGAVSSVAGKTGAVTLDANDVAFSESGTYDDGTVGKELSNQKNAISQKAPLIINTASGDIASFPDGADNMPIKKLVGTIVPVQSGTGDPSPDNVRPISGWTGANIEQRGKNLRTQKLSEMTEVQVSGGGGSPITSIIDDGVIIKNMNLTQNQAYGTAMTTTITKSGDELGFTISNSTYGIGICIELPENKSLKVYSVSNSTNKYVQFYNANKEFISVTESNVTSFVTPAGTKYAVFTFRGITNGTATVSEFCVYADNTASYEAPKAGNTLPINWQTEAGTMYGGYIDVVSGKLVVTKAVYVLDGSQNFIQGSQSNNWRWKFDGSLPVAGISPGPLDDVSESEISSQFVGRGSVYSDSAADVGFLIRNTNLWIRFGADTTITTAALAKQFFADHPTTFVYDIATPIEYTLTSHELTTLYGTNNIWIDTGAITECDYPADTKLYIDNKIATAIANALNA